MKKTFAIPLAVFLTSCAVYTPGGSVVVDPYRRVAPITAPVPGKNHFCPPGQAKKGNC
jgi:hypothetical protein